MGLKFYKKNIIDLDNTDAALTVTDVVATNNGEDFLDYMRNRNNTSGWMTTNSTDAANTTLVADFGASYDVDSILVLKHNLKAFTIKYWNLDTLAWTAFSTAIAETTNTADSNYYSFTKVVTTKIQIIITGAQVVNADKFINQLIVTELIGALAVEPQVKPVIDRSRKSTKFLSGKKHIAKSVPSFAAVVRMNNVTGDADLTLAETLFASNRGFLVSLSGGTESQYSTVRQGWQREDVYLMNCENEYKPEWEQGRYKMGMPIDLDLVEIT